jgi:hypothetical protein
MKNVTIEDITLLGLEASKLKAENELLKDYCKIQQNTIDKVLDVHTKKERLKIKYSVLSELLEEFPKNSKSKLALIIDKKMERIINELEKM